MTMKRLGNSDLEISPVGLGTWAIVGALEFRLGDDDLAKIDAALPESMTII